MKNVTFRITEIQRVQLAAHANSKGISTAHMARLIFDFYFNEFSSSSNRKNEMNTDLTQQLEILQSFLGVLNKAVHDLTISSDEKSESIIKLIKRTHNTQMEVLVPGIKRLSRSIVVTSPEYENDFRDVFDDPVAFGENYEK